MVRGHSSCDVPARLIASVCHWETAQNNILWSLWSGCEAFLLLSEENGENAKKRLRSEQAGRTFPSCCVDRPSSVLL